MHNCSAARTPPPAPHRCAWRRAEASAASAAAALPTETRTASACGSSSAAKAIRRHAISRTALARKRASRGGHTVFAPPLRAHPPSMEKRPANAAESNIAESNAAESNPSGQRPGNDAKRCAPGKHGRQAYDAEARAARRRWRSNRRGLQGSNRIDIYRYPRRAAARHRRPHRLRRRGLTQQRGATRQAHPTSTLTASKACIGQLTQAPSSNAC